MAAAIGTSDRMLLYYFADRDALLTAALGTVAARLRTALDSSGDEAPRSYPILLGDVWTIFRAPSFQPYLKLWLEVAANAAGGTEPFSTIGGTIADNFIAWAARRLDIADADKRFGAAALLLATIDGLALLEAVGRGNEAARAIEYLGEP